MISRPWPGLLLIDNWLGFIGFGRMGGALGHRLCQKTACQLMVATSTPLPATHWAVAHDRVVRGSVADVFRQSRIIFVAVKPQSVNAVSPDIAAHVTSDHVLISVMAGVSIQTLMSKWRTTAVVRTMPNMTVQVSCGVIGVYGLDLLSDARQQSVLAVLAVCGTVIPVANEDHLHAFTSIAGSSPAFFYQMAQVMVAFAVRQGMCRADAQIAVAQTMAGAGQMMVPPADLDQLITDVRSPNGTTHAGLTHMETSGFLTHWDGVLSATYQRSLALAQGMQS